ncbi:hypothetical protein EC991_010773 [Linnemannia zychae]|nr:hypothetical protein EC991_010773 [Linnemannia zychae]
MTVVETPASCAATAEVEVEDTAAPEMSAVRVVVVGVVAVEGADVVETPASGAATAEVEVEDADAPEMSTARVVIAGVVAPNTYDMIDIS